MKSYKVILSVIVLSLMLCMSCGSSEDRSGRAEKIVVSGDRFEAVQYMDAVPEKRKSVAIEGVKYCNVFLYKEKVMVSGFGPVVGVQHVLVRAFDKKFNLLHEYHLPIGEGPGDVGQGPHFFTVGDLIYAADNTQQRVNVFDGGFNFKKFVRIPSYPPVTFLDNGKAFLATKWKEIKDKTQYIVELVSFPEIRRKPFHYFDPGPIFDGNGKLLIGVRPMLYYFSKRIGGQDRIYVLNEKTYQAYIYDLDGQLLKSLHVELEPRPVPAGKRKQWVEVQVSRALRPRVKLAKHIQPATYMLPLSKGIAVIWRPGYGRECNGQTDAHYFSYDLELLGKVKIPCFFRIFKIWDTYFTRSFKTDDKHLYVTREANEGFVLEKWDLKGL